MRLFERWILLATSFLLFLPACASKRADSTDVVRVQNDGTRLLIRTGEITVKLRNPENSVASVERIVSSANGYVERSAAEEAAVWLTCRVPSSSLESVMDDVATLGTVVRRTTSTNDVTDQHADLTARLETSRQLRSRMRELLGRSSGVKDLLAVEKELARLQAEIEGMEAQIARLDSQIELSSVSIRLEQELVLGPLGFVGYWSWWAISKLFVIR